MLKKLKSTFLRKTSKQYFTEANSISKLDLIKDVSLFISLAITIIREGVLQLPIVFYERLMRQGCVIIGKSLRFIQLPCFTSLLQFCTKKTTRQLMSSLKHTKNARKS